MSRTYSTCLLCPDFSIQELPLTPNRSFPSGGMKIQLAGGFPSLFPDADCVLSPTLQLNKDLGRVTEEQLERIARAELARHNRMAVRNYVVDPSYMVCVISDDAERLELFGDTYGGLLEIEPVLINAEDSRYPQVTELAIEADSEDYRVIATTRAPVNTDTCTYCGACGPVCPEACISPSLRIDFGSCTFCRECEKVCPVEAIDIYGVVRREITTPAIVLLGEIELELPAARRASRVPRA